HARVDESLWLRWSAAHMSDAFKHALEAGRASRTARLQEARARHGDALAGREGLGDTKCLTAGCTRRALKAKVFCGHCLGQADALPEEFEIEADELRKLQALACATEAFGAP